MNEETADEIIVDAVHVHWAGRLRLKKNSPDLVQEPHGHRGTYIMTRGRLVVTWPDFGHEESFFLHGGRYVVETLQKGNSQDRHIRLKEFSPLSLVDMVPGDGYMHSVDSTLVQKPYRLETDGDGFIVSGQAIPANAIPIVILGDSVVESMYLDPDKRFCARLEGLLRDRHHLPVRVLNAGYSGATSLHCLNTVINKILPLKPACVILMTGIVDEWVSTLARGYWNTDRWFEPLVDLNCPNVWSDNDRLDHMRLEDRARILEAFHHIASLFDINFCYATVAHRQIFDSEYTAKTGMERASFDKQVEARRAVNTVTRSIAVKTGRPLFDLERVALSQTDIFYDMFHLNQAGGEFIAQALCDETLLALLHDNLPH